MKVLNLYAGIGGNRKLWDDVEVTAVELEPSIAAIYKDFFPDDKVIVADAHQYLLDHFREYDFIWSSPPCPTHSRLRKCSLVTRGIVEPVYPDMRLYQEIIFLNHHFDGLYCVENVIGYYKPLIKPQKIERHYFWANFYLTEKRFKQLNIEHCRISDFNRVIGLDLSSYTGINKKTVMRNCCNPKVGYHILDCARGKTQLGLTAFSRIKRIET